jgi:hypothetical protein
MTDGAAKNETYLLLARCCCLRKASRVRAVPNGVWIWPCAGRRLGLGTAFVAWRWLCVVLGATLFAHGTTRGMFFPKAGVSLFDLTSVDRMRALLWIAIRPSVFVVVWVSTLWFAVHLMLRN